MAKNCAVEGCKWPVWGKGYCKSHQRLRIDKKPKRPKYRTEKRAAQEAEYSRERKPWLELPENMWCAVYPWLRSTQVHHKAGRDGEMLLVKKYWLSVSDEGHRKIEMNPDWARDNGFTLSRLTDEEDCDDEL